VKRILLVLAALASAPLAQAQSDDDTYCAQLSALYRRYVQNATGRRVDVEALQALDDCSRGKAASAIPVLEKRLRDAKITPPGGGEFKP
jgi:murein L,D-transpeptidase YcbB/YkuD